jgi:hypothetical protein
MRCPTIELVDKLGPMLHTGHVEMETQRASWRSRSAVGWRGRKAALASRGETTGENVDECEFALSNWRLYTFLVRECNYSAEAADALVDSRTQTPGGRGGH